MNVGEAFNILEELVEDKKDKIREAVKDGMMERGEAKATVAELETALGKILGATTRHT